MSSRNAQGRARGSAHGERSELRGEIIEEMGDGWFVLLVGETAFEFHTPGRHRGKFAVGYRALLVGYHDPTQARRRCFHATWGEASRLNYDEERSAWLASWKASGGREQCAPLTRWSCALVIGTKTAVEDVLWWFDRCGVEGSECHWANASATPQQVLSALRTHVPAVQPDVIVLVRGGGEGVHLYDDLELVKEIARLQLRIPVVVGIGHTNQFTLADEVAITLGTPSYAAQFLVGLRDAEGEADCEAWLAATRDAEAQRLSKQAARRVVKWQVLAMGALFVGAAIGALFGGLLV